MFETPLITLVLYTLTAFIDRFQQVPITSYKHTFQNILNIQRLEIGD